MQEWGSLFPPSLSYMEGLWTYNSAIDETLDKQLKLVYLSRE